MNQLTAIHLLNVILGTQVSPLNSKPFHLQYCFDGLRIENSTRHLEASLKSLRNKIIVAVATKCNVVLFSKLNMVFTNLIKFIET